MSEVNNRIKNLELDFILEKIKSKKSLSESEIRFLSEFDSIPEIDHQSFSHLTKNQVFDKVSYYLLKNKKVICDLKDKNGKIDDEIITISNDYENDYCLLSLKHGETFKLRDNYFYKITYNLTKDYYSLESQDEFIEKIRIENED